MTYLDSAEKISPRELRGFFVGWPNPPTPDTHLRVLLGSDEVVLAVDSAMGHVVGFITVITDGVLAAHIPHLEVLPEFQGRGIGKELMRLILARLADYYVVDLLCDPDVQPFYKSVGMRPCGGMVLLRHELQAERT